MVQKMTLADWQADNDVLKRNVTELAREVMQLRIEKKRWRRAAIRLWQHHPCCGHRGGKDDSIDVIEGSLMLEKNGDRKWLKK